MKINKIEENIYEMPQEEDMRVPARVYATESMMKILEQELNTEWSTLRQLKNVATLPGIQKYALALADCHPGYGSPIGSIAAFDLNEGVIVFGLIGFDINCGLQTMKTLLTLKDIKGNEKILAEELYNEVPAGLGSQGKIKLTLDEMDELLVKGAEFVIERNFGLKEDLEFIEENGRIDNADPEAVSVKAKQRQLKEVGTLGAGNHYLEVQVIEKIFDEKIARIFGLFEGQIMISVHCGSRGLGHQIGTDYLPELARAANKYKIKIKDKELACAPINSEEGQKYLHAVNAGINCAFANREVITHLTREAFIKALNVDESTVSMLYGVAHNTAKIEEHEVNGIKKKLLVHRKGSTRGFAANRKEVPKAYREVGHPIIVGGTMGTGSYILVGTDKGMKETFGSAVHGAGRQMSRHSALKHFRGEHLINELGKKGIIIKGHSLKGLAEEAPNAYKDIHEVCNVMHNTGINKKVALLKPLIVVKG